MADRTASEEPDPELLDRYLAGECGDEESARVRRWLAANPDAARRLGEFLEGIRDEGTRASMPSVATSWRTLRRRMREPDAESATEREPTADRDWVPAAGPNRHRPVWRLGVAGAAACVVLVAAVSFVSSRVKPPVDLASPRRIYTATRERTALRLPDGTRVQLAPGSVLRVATDFGTERRDAFLEGEGYFEVAPDQRRQFTVFAANASVRALGAAFGVRAYARDGAVSVVVREGAVALTGTGRLQTGDLGRVTEGGETSIRHGVPVDSVLAWTDRGAGQ